MIVDIMNKELCVTNDFYRYKPSWMYNAQVFQFLKGFKPPSEVVIYVYMSCANLLVNRQG